MPTGRSRELMEESLKGGAGDGIVGGAIEGVDVGGGEPGVEFGAAGPPDLGEFVLETEASGFVGFEAGEGHEVGDGEDGWGWITEPDGGWGRDFHEALDGSFVALVVGGAVDGGAESEEGAFEQGRDEGLGALAILDAPLIGIEAMQDLFDDIADPEPDPGFADAFEGHGQTEGHAAVGVAGCAADPDLILGGTGTWEGLDAEAGSGGVWAADGGVGGAEVG